MTAATALLAEAGAAGVRLRLAGDRMRMAAAAEPPSDLLVRLRAHKAELVELLAGGACRHCGGPLDARLTAALPFGDGTAAHLACYEAVEERPGPGVRR